MAVLDLRDGGRVMIVRHLSAPGLWIALDSEVRCFSPNGGPTLQEEAGYRLDPDPWLSTGTWSLLYSLPERRFGQVHLYTPTLLEPTWTLEVWLETQRNGHMAIELPAGIGERQEASSAIPPCEGLSVQWPNGPLLDWIPCRCARCVVEWPCPEEVEVGEELEVKSFSGRWTARVEKIDPSGVTFIQSTSRTVTPVVVLNVRVLAWRRRGPARSGVVDKPIADRYERDFEI